MDRWKRDLWSGLCWTGGGLVGAFALALIVWPLWQWLGVPSFDLALGPLTVYRWVYAIKPGVSGEVQSTCGLGLVLLAVSLGALRFAWLQNRPRAIAAG